MIGQKKNNNNKKKKNNRTLYHDLIEKPVITFKNADAYQNYLESF